MDESYFDEARNLLVAALNARIPATAEAILEGDHLNRMEMIAVTAVAALLHMADTPGEVGITDH